MAFNNSGVKSTFIHIVIILYFSFLKCTFGSELCFFYYAYHNGAGWFDMVHTFYQGFTVITEKNSELLRKTARDSYRLNQFMYELKCLYNPKSIPLIGFHVGFRYPLLKSAISLLSTRQTHLPTMLA